MNKMSLVLDRLELSAQIHLGATLEEFFEAAGHPIASRVLMHDGRRLVSPEHELACRFAGARLTCEIEPGLKAEVPALTIEDLFALGV